MMAQFDGFQTVFLTWLDVERHFKRMTANFTRFPKGVLDINCYADEAEIKYQGSLERVNGWLTEIFGRSFSGGRQAVILQINSTPYKIVLSEDGCEPGTGRTIYPLWRDQTYAGEGAASYPDPWENGPSLVAFHSFKGGVGRTTAMMTYAAARLDAAGDRPVRILLIDADLEAPGISFWLADENPPTVSFVKLMEALHYPPDDVDGTLNYFAAELRKSSLNVGGAQREIFILPAELEMGEVMDMPISPSHLARNPRNPWQLTDHLHALGVKLGADMVMLDLRAGLSELSSPLLFDPRVEHFFVSTVAPQSAAGMAEVLAHLYRFQRNLPEDRRRLGKPSVIASLLTDNLRRLPAYSKLVEQLNAAYPADESDIMSPGIEWLEADLQESLMSIGSVREALEKLPKSSLYGAAQDWAKSFAPGKVGEGQGDAAAKGAAAALGEICERFQFAESQSTDDLLVIDPLRNLAKHFSAELPNVVVIGAKGAGKTFASIQICKTMQWANFVERTGHSASFPWQASIFPLLMAFNLEGTSLQVVQSARKACSDTLGFEAASEIRKQIRLGVEQDITDWERHWEQMLLSELGAGASTLEELNDMLLQTGKAVVLVVDGVEDIFDSLDDENSPQRKAVKALLELPNRLKMLEQRRVGLVCFVRADYVHAVIKQNVAQYFARFAPFKLEWTPESFLRLAYWLCGKAGIIGAMPDKAEALTSQQLLEALEQLWGKKMGGDAAKEANTARWVFAALCDLNGRLQARDLVRFLKFAAKQAAGGAPNAWPDRVLPPEAIRKSLPECSREKVEEAKKEIKALRDWWQALQAVPSGNKKMPFSADAIGLDRGLLDMLRELGIIYEDLDRGDQENRFYLPEIYRHGLDFQSSAGGRPRVQALLKRNLGGLPF